MKFFLLLILGFGLLAAAQENSEVVPYSFSFNNTLKTFINDGCSMFINGPSTKEPNLWRHCCEEHDMRYWFGGEQKDMDQADLRLQVCVTEVAGDNWGHLIYTGVRVGHYSPLKIQTHWGWGWTTPEQNLATLEDLPVLKKKTQLFLG